MEVVCEGAGRGYIKYIRTVRVVVYINVNFNVAINVSMKVNGNFSAVAS